MKRVALLVMTLTLLAGCGFHLRGSPALYSEGITSGHSPLQTPIVLRYPKSERAWAALLRTQLERSGIEIIDAEIKSPDENPVSTAEHDIEFSQSNTHNGSINIEAYPTLTLLKSEHSRRIASYTSRAKAAEYTLSERLTYQFEAPSGKLIVPKNTFTSERVYEFNVNNISGKDQEADLISSELQLDITMKLIRHIFNIAGKLNVSETN